MVAFVAILTGIELNLPIAIIAMLQDGGYAIAFFQYLGRGGTTCFFCGSDSP